MECSDYQHLPEDPALPGSSDDCPNHPLGGTEPPIIIGPDLPADEEHISQQRQQPPTKPIGAQQSPRQSQNFYNHQHRHHHRHHEAFPGADLPPNSDVLIGWNGSFQMFNLVFANISISVYDYNRKVVTSALCFASLAVVVIGIAMFRKRRNSSRSLTWKRQLAIDTSGKHISLTNKSHSEQTFTVINGQIVPCSPSCSGRKVYREAELQERLIQVWGQFLPMQRVRGKPGNSGCDLLVHKLLRLAREGATTDSQLELVAEWVQWCVDKKLGHQIVLSMVHDVFFYIQIKHGLSASETMIIMPCLIERATASSICGGTGIEELILSSPDGAIKFTKEFQEQILSRLSTPRSLQQLSAMPFFMSGPEGTDIVSRKEENPDSVSAEGTEQEENSCLRPLFHQSLRDLVCLEQSRSFNMSEHVEGLQNSHSSRSEPKERQLDKQPLSRILDQHETFDCHELHVTNGEENPDLIVPNETSKSYGTQENVDAESNIHAEFRKSHELQVSDGDEVAESIHPDKASKTFEDPVTYNREDAEWHAQDEAPENNHLREETEDENAMTCLVSRQKHICSNELRCPLENSDESIVANKPTTVSSLNERLEKLRALKIIADKDVPKEKRCVTHKANTPSELRIRLEQIRAKKAAAELDVVQEIQKLAETEQERMPMTIIEDKMYGSVEVSLSHEITEEDAADNYVDDDRNPSECMKSNSSSVVDSTFRDDFSNSAAMKELLAYMPAFDASECCGSTTIFDMPPMTDLQRRHANCAVNDGATGMGVRCEGEVTFPTKSILDSPLSGLSKSAVSFRERLEAIKQKKGIAAIPV